MTQAEKLEKLIGKATKNGWSDGQQYLIFIKEGLFGQGEHDYFEVIFNHDFAKALFPTVDDWCWMENPEQSVNGYYTDTFDTDQVMWGGPLHLYHLQQAVVSDDPIDYMYQAVFGNE